MEEYTLNGIRRDTVKRIFSVISEFKTITRQEIAEKTGLSLMTVGKITDILLDHKAVSYEKVKTVGVGRRAEYIKLTDKLYELVFIIKEDSIKCSLRNFHLEEKDSFTLKRANKGALQVTDELIIEIMSLFVENGIVGSCIGVGAVYYNVADTDFTNTVIDKLKDQFSFEKSYIGDVIEMAATGCALDTSSQKILYFGENGKGYSGVLVISGECILCGNISVEKEKAYDEILTISKFLSPDTVYIEDCDKSFVSENEQLCFVNVEDAGEYVFKGISHIVRQEYIQN